MQDRRKTIVMKIISSFDFAQKKFRYGLKQLADFERDKSVASQKYRTTQILLSGFIAYTLLTVFPALVRGYYHGVVTNISLALLFVILMIYMKVSSDHVSTVLLASFGINCILFFHFITETDWSLGMDAFWLFILIMPFIMDYTAGVVYGTIASFGGLALSIICFHTSVVNYLQPYPNNMIQWFSVIYIVVMIASIVIEYELTAYQIDKKISDEKIAFYQKERTNRLNKVLAIYENNEQTIRKYKHDIRHYNRVLAGLIHNEEYERAASYLREFDSMLESVTPVSFCENTIVNELLSIYASQCQKLGFKLRVKAVVPKRFPMEETDLTSLVANALENAVEAQTHIEEGKRKVRVEITYDGRKLKLFTQNPVYATANFGTDGLPVSTRQVQSGIGTAQIRSIAEKYSGVASFTQEGADFIVRAVMTCM